MMLRVLSVIQRQSRSLLANSALLIGNTFTGSIFGFLFWLVAARTCAPAEVGLGAAYISALTFLANLGELGLGTALIRFAPTAGNKQSALINSALALVGAATLAGALIFALGTAAWSPDLAALAAPGRPLALFLGATVAFGLAQLLDRVFVAFQVTHYLFARNLLGNVLRVGAVLVVGPLLGAEGLLLAVGLGAAITLVLGLLVFVPRTVTGYRLQPMFAWRLLRDKIGYTLGNHCAALLWSAPALLYPLLIVTVLGAEANAHFYISWMIANLLFIVPTAVSTAAFARAANAGQVDAQAFWRTMWRTMGALVPLALGLVVAAPLVLGAFGGDYHDEGRELFGVLVLSSLPYTFNTFMIVYHRIQQQVRRVVWVSGLTAVLCLGLSLVGGAMAALPGIGLGWLAGQVVGVGLAAISRQPSAASHQLSETV